jgi:sulfur-oxidizing protein SoxA
MKLFAFIVSIFFCCVMNSSQAQSVRQSGNVFLSPDMLRQQNDPSLNPLSLWLDQGQELWKSQCQECHSSLSETAKAVVQFPVWKSASPSSGRLINIEDQIVDCWSKKTGKIVSNDAAEILTMSVFLSNLAKGLSVKVREPQDPMMKNKWQEQMNLAAQIYVRRQGRLNLSCTQCHDQQIGKNLRSDVVSPAFLTGFPIYRFSWQTIGNLDRRLRACYSGVQASVPASGSLELRALELFLKKRSEGMVWDGPSLRR